MKTFLIIVLSLTLLAAAVFTRPSEASFMDFLTGSRPRTATSVTLPGPPGGTMSLSEAERFVDNCTIADRILWVDVTRDGRTLYTGAFGHWFGHAAPGPAELTRTGTAPH